MFLLKLGMPYEYVMHASVIFCARAVFRSLQILLFANWKRTFGQNKAQFGLFLLYVIEAHCGPKENVCISEKVALKCIIIATEVLSGFCCKVLKYEEFNHFIFFGVT